MKKYYTLIGERKSDQVWENLFGDDDVDVVIQERYDEYEDSEEFEHLTIICTDESQSEIDQAINHLNGVF